MNNKLSREQIAYLEQFTRQEFDSIKQPMQVNLSKDVNGKSYYSDLFLDKVIIPTGKIEKKDIFKPLPENWKFDFEKDYLADADVSHFIFCSGKAPKDETFGSAEQVITDLLSERIKTVASKPKNKKAGYKNKQYENTAKKAELSPLLKNLIKNIK